MAKKSENKSPPSSSSRAPEMQGAWVSFERGDYRGARKVAKSLLEGSASEQAKAEARDLLSRTGLEKSVAITLVVMTLTVTAIIIALSLR